MSKTKTPIFPITEPQHFSDYDFEVLEEARRHAKRGQHQHDRKSSLDSVPLKLQFQKPIKSRSKRSKHKHHHHHLRRTASAAGKWLRSTGAALLFWKRSKKESNQSRSNYNFRHPYSASYPIPSCCYSSSYSASGPLYMTESCSRAQVVTCWAKSGPYFNLRELNDLAARGTQSQRGSACATAMPVYLVT